MNMPRFPMTDQDHRNALADGLWWIGTHTQEIQQCVARLSTQVTPEDRTDISALMNGHITALMWAHEKYQVLQAWMDDPTSKEVDAAPRPDREAWDTDYEGIAHEDDATEDGA